MKELDTPTLTPAAKTIMPVAKSTSDEDTVIVDTPSSTGTTKKKKGKK
jgi:hypothetical protein